MFCRKLHENEKNLDPGAPLGSANGIYVNKSSALFELTSFYPTLPHPAYKTHSESKVDCRHAVHQRRFSFRDQVNDESIQVRTIIDQKYFDSLKEPSAVNRLKTKTILTKWKYCCT